MCGFQQMVWFGQPKKNIIKNQKPKQKKIHPFLSSNWIETSSKTRIERVKREHLNQFEYFEWWETSQPTWVILLIVIETFFQFVQNQNTSLYSHWTQEFRTNQIRIKLLAVRNWLLFILSATVFWHSQTHSVSSVDRKTNKQTQMQEITTYNLLQYYVDFFPGALFWVGHLTTRLFADLE